MPAKERLLQLARFCAVGAVCYAVGLGVLTVLCELAGIHYVASYIASFLITNVVGYLLNGHYTFGAASLEHASVSRYVAVNCILLVANSLALAMLVEVFHFWYLAATVVLAAANTPASFIAHRSLSYRLGRAHSRQ